EDLFVEDEDDILASRVLKVWLINNHGDMFPNLEATFYDEDGVEVEGISQSNGPNEIARGKKFEIVFVGMLAKASYFEVNTIYKYGLMGFEYHESPSPF